MNVRFRFCASLCVLAFAAVTASAQFEGELTAKRRLFPEVGVGLRALRQGGDRTYVLSSQGLLVFDAKEHKVLTIGSSVAAADAKAGPAHASFAEDFDVDASGQIYVADRAANLVAVYSADGARVRSFPVQAPLTLAVLSDGEVAVSTLQNPRLIEEFDKSGREIRDFGELEDISSREDLNRYLNTGYLATDARGELFYGFIYAPEPIIRVYDRNGYATQTIEFSEIEAFAAAQAARKEIERQERRGRQPTFKPILTAIGVVRDSGELWIALHNKLLRFDKDGNRKATYHLYAPDGAALDANALLVEKNRILIGNDPLGVFEFERPDIKLEQ